MKKKIMIVDDDPSILIVIREIFESRGYKVYAVNSGKDCIEELKSGFKGVILMDIMMPIMDGWKTIEEIKNNGLLKDNIISILTAKDDPGQNLEHYKDIIKDYITKPFDTEKLISTVNKYFMNI